MMKATDPQLLEAIRVLRKAAKTHEAEIWRALSEELSRPKHRRAAVNLSRISRSLKGGEIAAVPGKVLGAGSPGKISVAAFSFSETARRKIEENGGECLSLSALVERNPKGSGVRIVV